METFKQWLWNLLISIDQFANVLFALPLNYFLETPSDARFGSPDETLSSVFGKNVHRDQCKFCHVMCWFLDKIDPDHCAKSIEADERSKL